MDPLSIGAFIGVLLASKAAEKLTDTAVEKAAETVGEKAVESGWGLGTRALARVRGWFDDNDNTEGIAAINAIEAAPGNPESPEVIEFADLLSKELKPGSKVTKDLAEWITQARDDESLNDVFASAKAVETVVRSTNVSSGNVTVTGDRNIVISGVGESVNLDIKK